MNNYDELLKDVISKVETILDESKIREYVKEVNDSLLCCAKASERNVRKNINDEDYATLAKFARLVIENNNYATYAAIRFHMLNNKIYMKNILEILFNKYDIEVEGNNETFLARRFKEASEKGLADTESVLNKPMEYNNKIVACYIILTIVCWLNSGFWWNCFAIFFTILTAGVIRIRLDKKPEFNSKVGFMDSQDVYNLYKAGNLNLDYFNS